MIEVYGDIGEWDVSLKSFSDALKASTESVDVRINSFGGDAFQGIAMASLLRGRNATVYVDGIAASAATPMLCVASRVIMAPGSMVMLHNPWSMAVGDADAIRHEADVLDKVAGSYVSLYATKSGKSRDEVEALMRAESWLTAEEAVAFGIADEIAGELRIAASAKTVFVQRKEHIMGLFDGKRLAEVEAERDELASRIDQLEKSIQELTAQREEAASRATVAEAAHASALSDLEAQKAQQATAIEEARQAAVASVVRANSPAAEQLEPDTPDEPAKPVSHGATWLALRKTDLVAAAAYRAKHEAAILRGL